jgi:HEAT repeat protein
MSRLKVMLLLLAVGLAVLAAFAKDDRAGKPNDPDEQYLQENGIKTDDASLLVFLRQCADHDADLLNLEKLVRQLGADKMTQRQQASASLPPLGLAALPALRQAAQGTDAEIRERAKTAIKEIDKTAVWEPALCAARLLCRRKIDDAVPALVRFWAYYPVPDDAQADLAFSLHALVQAKPERRQLLEPFLTDPVPARRALAACLLGSLGKEAEQKKVRALLVDAVPLARLRAAQGLLGGRDTTGVPALIELLLDPSVDIAWQAEELLSWLAGDKAPAVYVGATKPAERGPCRAAWLDWWRANSGQVDVATVLRQPRRPLLVLAVESKPEPKRPENRLSLYGSNGRSRWSLGAVTWKGRGFQWLEGGSLLLGSSERDLQGRMLWEYPGKNAETVDQSMRLSNGHTWLMVSSEVHEYDIFKEQTIHWKADDNRGHGPWPYCGQPWNRAVISLGRQEDRQKIVSLCERKADTGKPLLSIPLDIKFRGKLDLRLTPEKNLLIVAEDPQRGPGMPFAPGEYPRPRSVIWELNHQGHEVRRWGMGNVKAMRPLGGGIIIAGKFHRWVDNGLFEVAPDGQLLWETYCPLDITDVAVCQPLVRLGFEPYRGDLGSANERSKGLKSPDVEIRRRSALALWSLQRKAAPELPAILTALNDNDEKTVLWLCDALREIGPAVVPHLPNLLQHSNPKVRWQAANCFGWTWPESREQLPHLLKALKDSDPEVRRSAILSIRVIGKEAALADVPRLIEAVEDEESEVQRYAILTIETLGNDAKPMLPVLYKVAGGRDCLIATYAMNALTKLVPKDPKLLELLTRTVRESKEPGCRSAAIYCLHQLGPVAKSAVGTVENALRDADADVRKAAEETLPDLKMGKVQRTEEFPAESPALAARAEEKAVEAVEYMGGRVRRNDKAAGHPVIAVSFRKRNLSDDPTFSDAGLKEFAALKQLRDLDLSGTNVTDAGLRDLAALKQLQKLNLAGTQITDAGLKHLAALKELESLGLYSTKVTDAGLKEVAALEQLQSLDLSYAKVTHKGLKELAALKQLQVLNLYRADVTDAGLKELAALRQLRVLNLSYTSVTSAGLKELATLKQLKSLDLNETKITDAGLKELAALEQLRHLSLFSSKITDAGLKDLAGLKQLQTLNLGGTEVSASGLKTLREALPNCDIIP